MIEIVNIFSNLTLKYMFLLFYLYWTHLTDPALEDSEVFPPLVLGRDRCA